MNAPVLTFQPVIRQVTLRTRDAGRLGDFYHKLLGLLPLHNTSRDSSLTLVHPQTGTPLLTLLEDPQATPAVGGAPSLFHLAFLFQELDGWKATMLRALRGLGTFHGAADHRVSWAGYLSDPDGNGVELAWDTPEDQWPWNGTQIEMVTEALPLRALLETTEPSGISGPFTIGHLHLLVGELTSAAMYQGELDLRVTQSSYFGAVFLARGRYHHHLAVNVWQTSPGVERSEQSICLVGWEMTRDCSKSADFWLDPYKYEVRLVS